MLATIWPFFSLLLGAGLTFVLTGVGIAGWRHKSLVWGFIVLGIAFFAAGIGWSWIKDAYPAVVPILIPIATPQSGFMLFILLAMTAAFGRRHAHVHGGGMSSLKSLGYDVLELARDIRKEFGNAYDVGLGLPNTPVSVSTISRISIIMDKLAERGFSTPRYNQSVPQNVMVEFVMRYFEYVGQRMVDDPSRAHAVAQQFAQHVIP